MQLQQTSLFYNGFGLYVIIPVLAVSVNIIRIFLPFLAVKLQKERLYPACQTAEAGRDGQHRELRSGERTGGCFTLCEGDRGRSGLRLLPPPQSPESMGFLPQKIRR